MKMTLDMLLYFIRDLHPRMMQKMEHEKVFFGVKQFFPEDEDLSDQYLYIANQHDLEKTPENLLAGLVFLTVEEEPVNCRQEQAQGYHLILVDRKYQIPYILNRLFLVFHRMSNWDKAMHVASLEGKSLQELVEIGEEVLEHPVLVFDAGFNLLAYSRNISIENQFIRTTIQRGYTGPEVLGETQKYEINANLKKGKPIVAPAAGNEQMYNVYIGFYEGQTLLGYAAVFCDAEVPAQGYLDLLRYFTDNLRFCLKRDFQDKRYGQKMYETFLPELMNPEGLSMKKINEQLSNVDGLTRYGRYALGILRFQDADSVPKGFVANLLQANLPDIRLFIYRDQFCLLRLLDRGRTDKELFSRGDGDTLELLLNSYPFSMGISEVFHDILDLRFAYEQADSAIYFGSREGKNVSLYQDYFFYHVFSCLEERMPLQRFQSELYRNVLAYDEQYQTRYIQIVTVYLRNNCNATRAAEELFLHRNTVRQAILFVEDTWQISLDKPEERERFLLSKYIEDYSTLHK